MASRNDMLKTRDEYINGIRKELLGPGSEISIPDKISGKGSCSNPDIADIYDTLDSMALVLQVKSVVPIKEMVSINLANRPLNM